jgi:hypothetical protein
VTSLQRLENAALVSSQFSPVRRAPNPDIHLDTAFALSSSEHQFYLASPDTHHVSLIPWLQMSASTLG